MFFSSYYFVIFLKCISQLNILYLPFTIRLIKLNQGLPNLSGSLIPVILEEEKNLLIAGIIFIMASVFFLLLSRSYKVVPNSHHSKSHFIMPCRVVYLIRSQYLSQRDSLSSYQLLLSFCS
eukprot:NODE_225_length_13912_cov_0.499674.p6 type:complete len:121 gc:universal NODE_225_length_13912_cov_0.499674:741-1103(+)